MDNRSDEQKAADALTGTDSRYPASDVRHWGVKGDGIADDAAALQRAFDNGVRHAYGRFRLSRPVYGMGRGIVIYNNRFISEEP